MLPEWAAVAVTVNNYAHDLATAVLAASAVMMFVTLGRLEARPSPDVARFVLGIYSRIALLAKVSLVWTLVGGIPRTIFFSRVEWLAAWGNGIIVALAVKHVIMVILVLGGALMWRRLAERYRELKAGAGSSEGAT